MTADTPADKPTRLSTQPTPPGRGLLFVRIGIVVALGIGVVLFGVLAIRDLTSGMTPSSTAPPTQARALQPGQGEDDIARALLGANSVQDLLSANYTPIDHDPAHLPAYPGARRAFCKRLADGEQYGDEQARYVGVEATVDQVLAHYQQAAQDAGFTPRAAPQPLQVDPQGRQQVFARGDSVMVVTVMSPTLAPPRPPPAAPPRPMLSFTVQFRYPIRSTP